MKPFFAIVLAAALILSSCTNEEHFLKGKEQLEQQGYTNVTSTGYTAWCCSDGDDYATGFTAVDKNGHGVKGCICSGFMKGITIRFE